MNLITIPAALFTINDFKTWSRLGRTKIYELIKNGELSAIKVGCRTYIPVDAAKSWLEAQPAYRRAA